MHKSIFLSLFLSIAFGTMAQNLNPITPELLMKNPDILWIGESEEIISLDGENNKWLSDEAYLTKFGFGDKGKMVCLPLKNQFDRRTVTFSAEDLSWSGRMIYGDGFKNVRAYKDAACAQVVKNPQDLAKTIDTIIVFDSETYAESTQVVVNPINPRHIQSYKLRQLFYFDKKANAFGCLPLAFAPIQIIYDDFDAEKFTFKELCWIKIDYSDKMLDLSSKDILWARQTMSYYTLERMKKLKSDKSVAECFAFHIETVRKNAKTEILRKDLQGFERISPQKIETIGDERDTIVTFEKETFMEIVEVRENILKPEDIKEIRFMREWYWDERQNKMIVHNLFFAPAVRKPDEVEGLIAVPLYYKQAK